MVDNTTALTLDDEIADEEPSKPVITIRYNIKADCISSPDTLPTEQDLPPGDNMTDLSFMIAKKRRRQSIGQSLVASLSILPSQIWCAT